MMRHTVVKVGEMRAGPLRDACAEYLKRLRPYAKIGLTSVKQERVPPDPSRTEREEIIRAESERLCRAAPRGAQVQWIALDQRGAQMSSPALADYLQERATGGVSHVVWIIGGVLGLSRELIDRADLDLSLSTLTFPHQMVPVILLEQIYRTCRIQRNEPYHY